MNKALNFLIGLLLLALMLGWVVVSGAIYNIGNRLHQTPHFFSVNALALQRVDEPKTLTELGDLTIRDMLIKKYVTEYFYVIPDTQNVEQRIKRHKTQPAWQEWMEKQSDEIMKLAKDGAMRTVYVTDIKNGDAGYLIVDYELKTWFTANDMSEVPTTTRGWLYMAIEYVPGVDESFENLNILEGKRDAAYAFKFYVRDIIQE